ncbi:MAG: thioredoxin family protein [Ignavibacteriaceae bacterium]
MATNTLKIGSKLPFFKLTATDGKIYSTDTFSDKKILIVIFSCNHCPYVKAYEDRIIKIQEDYKNKGVQIVAINSNDDSTYPEDSFENMKKRASEKNFNFPYLRDEDQSVAKAFDATHTPEIFVFDSDRKLAFHGKIDDNWKEPENVQNHYLKNALDELLNDIPVSVPETFTIGCTIKWKK